MFARYQMYNGGMPHAKTEHNIDLKVRKSQFVVAKMVFTFVLSSY